MIAKSAIVSYILSSLWRGPFDGLDCRLLHVAAHFHSETVAVGGSHVPLQRHTRSGISIQATQTYFNVNIKLPGSLSLSQDFKDCFVCVTSQAPSFAYA